MKHILVKIALAVIILIGGICALVLLSNSIHSLQNEEYVNVYMHPEGGIGHRYEHHLRRIEIRQWPKQQPLPFIGIAISGGGSRAANFAAAVLQYLDRLGILQHATAISSVSGGSLTAAYYALKRLQSYAEWDEFRRRLRTNFLENWASRVLFSPRNWARFLTTEYNRTDVLAGVLDDELLGKATFGDLPDKEPRLFINATSLSLGGKQISFTNTYFDYLSSRASNYPLSYAVSASGAFPGIFRSVKLARYRPWRLEFQFDEIFAPTRLASRILNEQSPFLKYFRSLVPNDALEKLKPLLNDRNSELELKKVVVSILNGSVWQVDRSKGENGRVVYKTFLQDYGLLSSLALSPKTLKWIQKKDAPLPNEPVVTNFRILADFFSDSIALHEPENEYLFDGGPPDNLGVQTLQTAADHYFSGSRNSEQVGCLFILIDAYVTPKPNVIPLEETNLFSRLLILDSNVLNATDAMLSVRRSDILRELGVPQSAGTTPKYAFVEGVTPSDQVLLPVESGNRERSACHVWHLSFQRLVEMGTRWMHYKGMTHPRAQRSNDEFTHDDRLGKNYMALFDVVNAITTNYVLAAPGGCSSQQLQTLLYEAARVLVLEDKWTIQAVNHKLKEWRLKRWEVLSLPDLSDLEVEKPALKEYPFIETMQPYPFDIPVGYGLPNGNILPQAKPEHSFLCDPKPHAFWASE